MHRVGLIANLLIKVFDWISFLLFPENHSIELNDKVFQNIKTNMFEFLLGWKEELSEDVFDNVALYHGFVEKNIWLCFFFIRIVEGIFFIWVFIVWKVDAKLEEKAWLNFLKTLCTLFQNELDPIPNLFCFLCKKVVVGCEMKVRFNFWRLNWLFLLLVNTLHAVYGLDYFLSWGPVQLWLLQNFYEQVEH